MLLESVKIISKTNARERGKICHRLKPVGRNVPFGMFRRGNFKRSERTASSLASAERSAEVWHAVGMANASRIKKDKHEGNIPIIKKYPTCEETTIVIVSTRLLADTYVFHLNG